MKKKVEENLEEEILEEEVLEETVEEAVDEIQVLEAEIESLKLALENEHNNFLKAHADSENTKRRLTNDFNQKDKYKIQSFALSLLPAIDNMEKVLADDNEDNTSLKEAIEMIYRQLMNSLESEGVSVIETKDQAFDPMIHHAVMLDSVEGVEPDMVLEELQKGYKLKDRVLRASMVKVSQ